MRCRKIQHDVVAAVAGRAGVQKDAGSRGRSATADVRALGCDISSEDLHALHQGLTDATVLLRTIVGESLDEQEFRALDGVCTRGRRERRRVVAQSLRDDVYDL